VLDLLEKVLNIKLLKKSAAGNPSVIMVLVLAELLFKYPPGNNVMENGP
jgi:hypothetical protein